MLNNGLLINPLEWIKLIYDDPSKLSIFKLIVGAIWFYLVGFLIEKYVFPSKLPFKNYFGLILILFNLISAISIFHIVILMNDCLFLGAFIASIVYFVLTFKLISYHMANYWCREQQKVSIEDGKKIGFISENENSNENNNLKLVNYPDNLYFNDMVYYILAPTFCYEINYPRNERIRKGFLIKRLLELVS